MGIKIESDGIMKTKVFLDGKELTAVTGIKFEGALGDSYPRVHIDMICAEKILKDNLREKIENLKVFYNKVWANWKPEDGDFIKRSQIDAFIRNLENALEGK